MFDFLGKYFWVIAIALTLVNYRWKTARLPPQSNGDNAGTALYRRALAVMISPWLVMGVGIVFGGVPGVWSYFRPQDMNPYVWAWYLCIFMLACGFAYWVFFRGGARQALELQLIQVVFFGRPLQMNEQWIKIYAGICPVFVIFWIWVVWHMDAPVPGMRR